MAISDDQVQWALDTLLDESAAKKRAAHEWMQDHTKVVKARLEDRSPATTVSGRESDAYAHTDYEEHLQSKRRCAEEDYAWRNRRDAAQAILDAWRTEQSTQRTMGKIQ